MKECGSSNLKAFPCVPFEFNSKILLSLVRKYNDNFTNQQSGSLTFGQRLEFTKKTLGLFYIYSSGMEWLPLGMWAAC